MTHRRFQALAAALALLLASALPAPTQAADAISAAEQRLFLDAHLGPQPAARDIRYRYTETSSEQPRIDDAATLHVGSGPVAQRSLAVDFLSGARKLDLGALEPGAGNPVILHFLERDVRQMQVQLGGQSNYFRRRIRLALADSATIERIEVTFAGRRVPADRITVTPFVDDPLAPRFRQQRTKRYRFTLSDAVAGGVVELRTTVEAGSDPKREPAIETVLALDPAA